MGAGKKLADYLELSDPWDLIKIQSNVKLLGVLSGAKPVATQITPRPFSGEKFESWMNEMGMKGIRSKAGSYTLSRDEESLRQLVDARWEDHRELGRLYGYPGKSIDYFCSGKKDKAARASRKLAELFHSDPDEEGYAVLMAGNHYLVNPEHIKDDKEFSMSVVGSAMKLADGMASGALKERVSDSFYLNMLRNIAYNVSSHRLNALEQLEKPEDFQRGFVDAMQDADSRFRGRLGRYSDVFRRFLSQRGYHTTIENGVGIYVQYVKESLLLNLPKLKDKFK